MHKIKLEKLVFSNLMSYGNNDNEVNFTDGLTWIKGSNGVGKSTLVEALSFALFGRPYRNILKSEIKNASNKSKLKTDLYFSRVDSSSTDEYRIYREMTTSGSSSLVVYKNGKELPKEAGMTQQYLEDEVFGFNKNIFENVISLNTIQSTPFIDMTPAEKRGLIESVLSLCTDKIRALNKTAIRETTANASVANSDVESYGKSVEGYKSLIVQMEQEIVDSIGELQSTVKSKEKEVEDLNIEVTNLQTKIDELTSDGVKYKESIEPYSDVDSKISLMQSVIYEMGRIETNKTELDKATKELSTIQDKVTPIQEKITELEKSNPEARRNELVQAKSTKMSELGRISSDVDRHTRDMDHIVAEGKALKAGVPCPTCGKPSTEEDIEPLKEAGRKKWLAAKDAKADAESKMASIDVECEKIDDEIKSIDVVISELNSLRTEVSSANVPMYIKLKDNAQDTYNSSVSVIEKSGFGSVDEINENIKNLTEKKEWVSSIKEKMSELREEIVNKTSDKKHKSESRDRITNEIVVLNDKIKKLQSDDSENTLSMTKASLAKAEVDLQDAKERVTKHSNDISVYKYIDSMYSDDGIKKFVLQLYVPTLNKAIEQNLSIFSLPFSLTFNDSMEYTFESRFGSSPSYNGLSQGQRRKLNFAISMAFRDFVTLLSDFDINILFLDEVLDVSTDNEALRDMLSLLKEKVSAIGEILVITHRGELFTEYFDRELLIEHDGTYSRIVS